MEVSVKEFPETRWEMVKSGTRSVKEPRWKGKNLLGKISDNKQEMLF